MGVYRDNAPKTKILNMPLFVGSFIIPMAKFHVIFLPKNLTALTAAISDIWMAP